MPWQLFANARRMAPDARVPAPITARRSARALLDHFLERHHRDRYPTRDPISFADRHRRGLDLLWMKREKRFSFEFDMRRGPIDAHETEHALRFRPVLGASHEMRPIPE